MGWIPSNLSHSLILGFYDSVIQKANLPAEHTRVSWFWKHSEVHISSPWVSSQPSLEPVLCKHTSGVELGQTSLAFHSIKCIVPSHLHCYAQLVLCATGRKAAPHIQVIFMSSEAVKYPAKIHFETF